MPDDLDRLVLTRMPYFIATHYASVLDATSTEAKVRAALRVYELGIRTLALALVSQYLIRDYDRVSDQELNHLLETKLPNATLTAWQRILFLSLRAYGGQPDLLFVSELYDFYWDRSVVPHAPRSDIITPFNRMTQIRNNLEWKDLTPQDEAGWQGLYAESINLLKQIIGRQFAFFQNYEMIRVVKREDNRYWYESHTGLEIKAGSDPLETEHELGLGWFYLSKDGQDFLKLHPLITFQEGGQAQGEVAIYDRYLKDDNVIQYLTAKPWQKIVDDTNVFDFVRMLYTTLEQYKRGQERYQQLTWWKLQEVTQTISQLQMATVFGKYQANLYLQRHTVKTAFEHFLVSDKVCFVLTGKSGVGKSNFLLALAEEYRTQRSNVCLLMYDGARVDPNQSLTETILQDFNQHLRFAGEDKLIDIWSEIASIADLEGRKVVLLIDAINENPQGKELLKRIDELVLDSNWPWLKIVVTSRPEAWQTIKRGIRLAEHHYYRQANQDKLGVEMEPFTYSLQLEPFSRDELPLVYEKYRQVFQLQTTYANLPVDVRIALRDPLLMRLVASTYQGQKIPQTLKINEIYTQYLDGLIRTGRLRIGDVHFLTEELMPLMIREGHYANAIVANEVDTAVTQGGKSLFELIHNDGILADGRRFNQSYVNLTDAAILVQRGDALNYEIGFQYERFYDYFGGQRLYERCQEKGRSGDTYLELVQELQSYPFLWGAINNALSFELEAGRQELIVGLCYTEVQAMKEMIVVTLSEYGLDKAEETNHILELLTDSQQAKEVKQGLGKQLAKEHWPTRLRNAKEIAIEVAGLLGNEQILLKTVTDPDPSIRTHTARQIFYLWQRDASLGLTSLEANRGLRVMDSVAARIRNRLGLPDKRALEVGLGTILLVFMATYREAKVPPELQEIAKKGLAQLMYIGQNRFIEPLVARLRDWALSIVRRFVIGWLGEAPKYNAANVHELSTFHDLPAAEKRGLLQLLPYYDASLDLEDIRENLIHAAELNDTVTSWTIWEILILHGVKKPDQVRELVKQLFEIGMSSDPSGYFVLKMVETLEGIARLDKTDHHTFQLYDQLWRARYEATKGRLQMKYKYITPSIAAYLICADQREGWPGPNSAYQTIEAAKAEDDLEFLLATIWELGFLGSSDRYYHLALEALGLFADIENERVQAAFFHLLARMRQHHTNAIDDFMEDKLAKKLGKEVLSMEVREELGGDLMYMPVVEFFAYAGLTPTFSRTIVWSLEQGVQTQTTAEWLLLVAKRVVNLVYGNDIFSLS